MAVATIPEAVAFLDEIRELPQIEQTYRKAEVVEAHDVLWKLCRHDERKVYADAMQRIILYPEMLWTIGRMG